MVSRRPCAWLATGTFLSDVIIAIIFNWTVARCDNPTHITLAMALFIFLVVDDGALLWTPSKEEYSRGIQCSTDAPFVTVQVRYVPPVASIVPHTYVSQEFVFPREFIQNEFIKFHLYIML